MEIEPDLQEEIDRLRKALTGAINRQQFIRLRLRDGNFLNLYPLEIKTIPSEVLGTVDIVCGLVFDEKGFLSGRKDLPIWMFDEMTTCTADEMMRPPNQRDRKWDATLFQDHRTRKGRKSRKKRLP